MNKQQQSGWSWLQKPLVVGAFCTVAAFLAAYGEPNIAAFCVFLAFIALW